MQIILPWMQLKVEYWKTRFRLRIRHHRILTVCALLELEATAIQNLNSNIIANECFNECEFPSHTLPSLEVIC
jgi:hypothetical protein